MVWLSQFKQLGKTLYKLRLTKILNVKFFDHPISSKWDMKTCTMLFVKYYNTIKAVEPIFLAQYKKNNLNMYRSTASSPSPPACASMAEYVYNALFVYYYDLFSRFMFSLLLT